MQESVSMSELKKYLITVRYLKTKRYGKKIYKYCDFSQRVNCISQFLKASQLDSTDHF